MSAVGITASQFPSREEETDREPAGADVRAAFNKRFERGPVRVLCDEIGFPFSRGLERVDVFVAFVRELVSMVADQRHVTEHLASHGGAAPSEASAEALRLSAHMLAATDPEEMRLRAVAVHDHGHTVNPDMGPCDHMVDMLSSCASAIRFGLEPGPCRSRHAASAANHVWKQRYGIRLFDKHTSEWSHAWSRAVLIEALTSLLPAAEVEPVGSSQVQHGTDASEEAKPQAVQPDNKRKSHDPFP